MTKIRIGIIGVGIIAEQHLTKYREIEDCEVVAACDILPDRLASFCDRWNIPDRYESITELLQRDDLDVIDVCLHNNLHAPVTIAALHSGKDVYCEKPMSGSYYDSLRMYEAAQETGQTLHIQLAHIYTYETDIARKLIQAGELGSIYHLSSKGFRRRGRPYVDGYARKEFVNSEWSGGGALFDMAVYHISQLLYLTDNPEPLRMTGHVYQETELDPRRAEISGYDVEEFAVGMVDFGKNFSMSVTESWAVHMDGFEGSGIFGSQGGIKLNPFSFHSNRHDYQWNGTVDLQAARYREENVHPENLVYRESQRHLVAALQGKCELIPTADIALNTSLIQEGIYLSSQLGRQVTSEEVKATSESKSRVIPNLDYDLFNVKL